MANKKNTRKELQGGKPPQISVRVKGEGLEQAEFQFRNSFQIGRDEGCEVRIAKPGISRHHAEVTFREGRWWLIDLGSANGIYMKGRKAKEVPLGLTQVELGLKDAVLHFTVEGYAPQDKTQVQAEPSVTEYVERYFSGDTERPSGAHTRKIREAYQVVHRRQKGKYFVIIGLVAIVATAIGVYSYYQQQELERQKLLAEEIFYSMKTLELEIAQLESRFADQNDPAISEKLEDFEERENQFLHNYERFLQEIEFYEDSEWSETDRVILKVARLFGECELGMPPEFLELVYEYIAKWKTTSRLQRAIKRAEDRGYDEAVVQVMLEHDLPPHFFFLALQESDFRDQIVGPPTRFGIAKGIWQFIPATAVRYGLKTGPLVELRRFDPQDERFVFEKATRAAARYLKEIYNTEAQASGLLVIASYNWGEGNIRNLVRSMPMNPRERNFWQLLEQHGNRLPKETYDYVFYIISAAIIAEDPKLFGFEFESPLEIPE